MALRGHRDDSQYHPDVGESSTGSVGNFIELLNYRVSDRNKYLEKQHTEKVGPRTLGWDPKVGP